LLVREVRGASRTEDAMPSYEIRYRNSEGELTLVHKTHHVDDEAVDVAAFRLLMGSGLADYEIWREDEIAPTMRTTRTGRSS
jgi:hypothetical protein